MISIHLFGNTELGQIFKLPMLMTHFFQHHRQNPGISFSEFIAMHYGGTDGTNADDDMDNQLPCHNLHQNTFSVVYSSFETEIPSIEFPVREICIYGDRLLTGNPSKHVSLILQPPRKA